METYRIFVASSMINSQRKTVESKVNSVNATLKHFGFDISFDLIIFEDTPMDKGEPKTQKVINGEAIKSDLFILLADNNTTLGRYTIEEYEKVVEQSQKSSSKIPTPYIKAFVITKEEKEKISLKYRSGNVKEEDFESRLNCDSERYLQCISNERFPDFFQKWLENFAIVGIGNSLTQDELSYEDLLLHNGQGERRSDNKYYRRDGLDGEIERLLQQSPIVILEGNTYSGKTRAAFELMKNSEEWKKCDFHIYSSESELKSLTRIRLNRTSDNNGDVYLFDDINEVIKNNELVYENSLWAEFNGFNKRKGFKNEDFGNTRIIITISGQLLGSQKKEIYKKIFNIKGDGDTDFDNFLESIIVDFDSYYNKNTFREMVDEMRRNGVQIGNVIQGNYTIGSLFIDEAKLTKTVKDLYKTENGEIKDDKKNRTILKTIACHYRYAQNSSFTGDIDELQSLYTYYNGQSFGIDLDILRKKKLLVKSKKQTIHIDSVILKIINDIVCNDKDEDSLKLNESLINYAADSKSKNISSVAQMGYLLCDRNDLSDEEIFSLIDFVADKVLKDKNKSQWNEEEANRIERLTEISLVEGRYNQIFCETAIARLHNFESVKNHIDFCEYIYEQGEQKIKKMYKRIIYAMFSRNNREMTMQEEQIMLSYIFNEDKSWKEPFCEEDLKDVFNLQRISPFLGSLTAIDIIDYVSKSTLDGCNMSPMVNKNNRKASRFTKKADISFDKDLYERVFIPRVRDVLITALCLINNFKEFDGVREKIESEMKTSEHLKNALKILSSKFYKSVPEIARCISFEDRKRFFDFLFGIESDSETIFGNMPLDEQYNYKKNRIMALNQLLELLDENDALESCNKMLKSELHDKRTLSHLFKNEFLNFEQMLPLVEEYDEQKHFITLNQLMTRAETKTDALTCMREMKIDDGNAVRLKDERALSQYINIKDVKHDECIKIIREWHKKKTNSNRTLSSKALNPIMRKFTSKELFDILIPERHGIDYMEKFGLREEEIELMRKNPIFYNLLFFKANNEESYKDNVESTFNKLLENKLLEDKKFQSQKLILDPVYNEQNSIFSVYIKNKWLFDSYEKVEEKIAELSEKSIGCIKEHSWRKDDNIYGPIVWRLAKDNNICKLNAILKEAYNYFALYYTRKDVERMMAKLYKYIPLCINEMVNDSQKIEIAYEGETYVWGDFKSYLKHVLKNNPNYIDGTFIFNTLNQMTNEVIDEVYECLKEIVKCNRKGLKFDAISQLPELVQARLFQTNKGNGTISIDGDFFVNIPKIKMLCYILDKKLLTVEQVENYRKNNHIEETQTYCNMLFKAIEEDNGISKSDRFNKMTLQLPSDDSKRIKRSVQMCISLIAVAPEKSLNEIFTDYGFSEFQERTEVIAALMKKILQLRYKQKKADQTLIEFKQMILKNCFNVNIWIVNIFLSTFIKIFKKELYVEENRIVDFPFKRCWSLLRKECKVDMFELLNLQEDEKNEIVKQLSLVEKKWVVEANVQTFSYFAQCTPNLISIMDGMFNGDFTYDDSGKKSCLKDALKNFSFVYDKHKLDTGCLQNEIKNIAQILWRINNRKVFEEICDEYILKSSLNKRTNEWQTINSFWRDLLNFPNLRDVFAHHVCYLAVQMLDKKSNKHISLDESDSKRIEIIRSVLCLENFDNKLKKKMHDCYNKVKSEAENSGGKLLGKNAKLAKMSFSNIFVSMLYPQIQN